MLSSYVEALSYNIDFEVTALFFDLVLFLYVTKVYHSESAGIRRFRIFSLLVLVGTAVDILVAIPNSNPPRYPLLWQVGNFANILLGNMTAYAFLLYVMTAGGVEDHHHLFEFINRALLLADTALLIVNIPTGIIMRIGPGRAPHGPLYYFGVFGVSAYFVLAGFFVVLHNLKRYRKEQVMLIIVAVLLVAALYVLQIVFFPRTYLVFAAASIGELALLFTLETPDYQQLTKTIEELDTARTEAKEAERRAVEANQVKSEFLITMSDAFRTPVNAVLGFSELILESTSEEKTRQYAEKIRTAGRRILGTFNDAIRYAAADYESEGTRTVPMVPRIEDEDIFHDYVNEWDDWEKERGRTEEDGETKETGESGGQNEKATGASKQASVEKQTKTRAGQNSFRVLGARILCVDDNEMNLFLLVRRLQKLGAKTIMAYSGESALAQLRENTFDLVFMDHLMPDMDGVEALHAIRRQHLCDGIPIIVLTANIAEEDRQNYLAEGFDGYLAKPFTSDDLCRVLQEQLPERLWEGKVPRRDAGVARMVRETEKKPPVETVKPAEKSLESRPLAPEESGQKLDLEEWNRLDEWGARTFLLFGMGICGINAVVRGLGGSGPVLWQTIALLFYFIVLNFILRKRKERNRTWKRATMYLIEGPVFLSVILMGTVLDPESQSYTFLLTVALAPLFILDRKRNVFLYITGWTAAFLAAAWFAKPAAVFYTDAVHVLGFYIASVSASMFFLDERFEDLKSYTRLKYLMEHDEVTGLKNHHAMLEDLQKRSGEAITLLVTSIDNLRTISDTCGIREGDALLWRFGELVSSTFGSDVTYRFNGAQLVVLLPGDQRTRVREECRSFSDRLGDYGIGYKKLRATCSGSYIYGTSDEKENVQELLRRADLRMYELQTFGKGHFAEAYLMGDRREQNE